MKTTPVYGWSYPESTDHTRTWEYWQAIAMGVETTLSGQFKRATSTTRPAATAGALLFETDTNRMMVGIVVATTPYWVPLPGTNVFAIRQTTVQSIPDGAYTPLNYQAVDYDPFAFWAAGTPTRFAPKFPGWFELNGGASFASNAVNYRATIWYKNAAPISGAIANQTGTSGTGTAAAARPTAVYLNGTTDYAELYAMQTSGAALSTSITAQFQSTLLAKYLGP